MYIRINGRYTGVISAKHTPSVSFEYYSTPYDTIYLDKFPICDRIRVLLFPNIRNRGVALDNRVATTTTNGLGSATNYPLTLNHRSV